MGKLRWLLVVLIAAVWLPSPVLGQERGTITGTVVDQTNNRPLVGATVTISGTALRGVTNQEGRYRVANVPAGSYETTASILGYAPRSQRVAVAAGATATANFLLSPSALEIGGLVVTATGREQRQREIGSSVGVVNVAEVELAPVTSMTELIQGRVAGTVVLPSSGTTGAGARIRIRGSSSMSLGNDPLIIVDGIRAYDASQSLGFGVGGQAPSRLNDLNPEDIENIEILKGPAASALYGTAAANGVIQITTKRGRAGRAQVRGWTEFGQLERPIEFPDNVRVLGRLVGAGVPAGGVIGLCTLRRQAFGATPPAGQIGCAEVTEVQRFNPLENPETSPFQDGFRRQVGASASGGSESATFYVSGEYEEEDGILPQNDLKRVKVQANFTGNLGERLNVGGNFGFIESDLQLPLGDNALYGIVPMGLFGAPTPANIEANQGFQSNPEFFSSWKTFQDFSRFTGSVRGDFRPVAWLALNGTAGLDRIARDEINRIPRESIRRAFGGVSTFGFIQNFDYEIYNLTTNGSATAVFDLTPELTSTTTFGTNWIRESLNRVYAFGATLTPGIETSLAGATTDFEVSEANTLNATLGAYAQQQFAWRDRVFVNAAVRGDQNTAFGTDIGWIWYPAFSASWVVSEEPFFPTYDWLSNFRVRAAYGQSGLRPGATDALLSFSPAVAAIGNVGTPAFIFNEIGNPDLKPERSTEWEAGFESGFFDGRFGVEGSYFHKTSEDALISRPLPPSVGAATRRFENLGEVRNSGFEFALSAQALRTRDVRWNARVSGSFIQNELVDLGVDPQGEPIPDIVSGVGVLGTQRHREGFPLGAFFVRPVNFNDADGNGMLSPLEVTLGDSVEFAGNPFPSREFSFNTDLSFRDVVRLSALLDYKGGHELFNITKLWRCNIPNCEEAYIEGASLQDQAAIVAWSTFGQPGGFIEEADFLKLREVAVTLNVPRAVVSRFGAGTNLSVTLAGRNLKTWTDYTGFDPELNFGGQSNFLNADFGTLPPNRYYTIRIDANF